jgi:hypothetical protein
MTFATQVLLAASAAIVFMLGTLHLVFTFSGPRFHPRDADLAARMKEVSPYITRQTTIWRAGLGFHVSHSLGAMLFGLAYGYLALEPAHFLGGALFLQVLGLVYQLCLVALAWRYWFKIPLRGVGLACVLYAVGLAVHHFS